VDLHQNLKYEQEVAGAWRKLGYCSKQMKGAAEAQKLEL
jgi:hypothetical protein